MAAIGCTEIGQPIGVTVESHWFEQYEGEGWVAVDNEKTPGTWHHDDTSLTVHDIILVLVETVPVITMVQ